MIKNRLCEYLKVNLSSKRYRHSLATGAMAEGLCGIYHLPRGKGMVAGLGHDIAREIEPHHLIKTASKMFTLEEWELDNLKLLHGKAGAVIMQEKFNIDDEQILEAIAWHTTGVIGMGELAKIVYIADYIEPNRKYDNSQIRDYIDKSSLDDAFTFILEKKMEYLSAAGRNAVPPTQMLYDAIESQRSIS